MSNFDDVKAFHRKFEMLDNDTPRHLTKRKLFERVEFLQEELMELSVAVLDQDLAAQADALIDLVYVAMGTASMMGLPWEELWDDVHRANMAKVRGTTHRGNKVDVMKPEGWVGPKTMDILNRHGYDASTHSKEENHCDDALADPHRF